MTEYKKRAIHREQRVEEDEEDGGKVDEEKGEEVAEVAEVAEKIVKAVETRQRTIETLRSFAALADELHQERGNGEMWTSGIGVTGGLLTVGSGIATIMTAGATAPIIGALAAMSGTGFSLIGGGVSINNTVGSTKRDAKLRAKITEMIKEDQKAIEEFHRMLAILEFKDDSFNEKVKNRVLGTKVLMGISSFNYSTTILGFEATWDLLIFSLPELLASEIPPHWLMLIPMVGAAMKEAAKRSAVETTEVVAKEGIKVAAVETTEVVAKEGTKVAAVETTEVVAKEGLKVVAVETTEVVAKEGTKVVAVETTEVVAKEGIKVVAVETTEVAAKEGTKVIAVETTEVASTQAMKTAGGITAGLGVLTVLWEGYNFKKGYDKKTSNSPLGDELRTLADKLAEAKSQSKVQASAKGNNNKS